VGGIMMMVAKNMINDMCHNAYRFACCGLVRMIIWRAEKMLSLSEIVLRRLLLCCPTKGLDSGTKKRTYRKKRKSTARLQ
jgi:hypothetical protein